MHLTQADGQYQLHLTRQELHILCISLMRTDQTANVLKDQLIEALSSAGTEPSTTPTSVST